MLMRRSFLKLLGAATAAAPAAGSAVASALAAPAIGAGAAAVAQRASFSVTDTDETLSSPGASWAQRQADRLGITKMLFLDRREKHQEMRDRLDRAPYYRDGIFDMDIAAMRAASPAFKVALQRKRDDEARAAVRKNGRGLYFDPDDI